MTALVCLLACCSLPPRVDDRSTPAKAYETFRGAVARAEHGREFACLSDRLRRKIGATSSVEWRDARVVVLTQHHPAVRGIIRSSIRGEPETLPDGRALLHVRVRYLVFGRDARVWLRPVPVLKIYAPGSDRPEVYVDLPELALVLTADAAGVRLPPELLADIEASIEEGRIGRFEAAVEWFLDDFEVGDETPDSVRKERERGG